MFRICRAKPRCTDPSVLVLPNAVAISPESNRALKMS